MKREPEAVPGNLQTARDSWGAKPPAWIVALAEACDASSQSRVSVRLGISAAVVNQALKNTYAGRLDRVEERVRGELLRETVACPVLGEITKRECLDNQNRGYEATNPTRVKLFQTCRKCHFREGAES